MSLCDGSREQVKKPDPKYILTPLKVLATTDYQIRKDGNGITQTMAAGGKCGCCCLLRWEGYIKGGGLVSGAPHPLPLRYSNNRALIMLLRTQQIFTILACVLGAVNAVPLPEPTPNLDAVAYPGAAPGAAPVMPTSVPNPLRKYKPGSEPTGCTPTPRSILGISLAPLPCPNDEQPKARRSRVFRPRAHP
ncbi:hypothetical protein BDV93DRAFT_540530 [Ceratobasidium sp. AG-I]|nr:hypothetical protein BDV93DRAFT_540530 [Ceratobasidium sp. AG-I]